VHTFVLHKGMDRYKLREWLPYYEEHAVDVPSSSLCQQL